MNEITSTKAMKFEKVLFWDIDISKLDFEKNARQIIERVLMYGDLKDWFEIKNYYALERLKKEVVRIRYLLKLRKMTISTLMTQILLIFTDLNQRKSVKISVICILFLIDN